LALALSLPLAGCGVSEEEYGKITAEVEDLKRQLGEAQKENLALNEAVLEVYKERDRLLARVDDLEKKLKTLDASASTEEPQFYVVQAGDTWAKVAQKTKLTVEKLKELNRPAREYLYSGQKLKLN
jgi:LysM repeat protein